MRTTYEKRNQQRLILGNLGLKIVIFGVVSFVIFLISAFLDLYFLTFSTPQLMLWAVLIICFGVVFTLIFGRIGWHENVALDFLLNQFSAVLSIIGAVGIVIVNIFLENNAFIEVCLGITILGFILALIGIRLHKPPY